MDMMFVSKKRQNQRRKMYRTPLILGHLYILQPPFSGIRIITAIPAAELNELNWPDRMLPRRCLYSLPGSDYLRQVIIQKIQKYYCLWGNRGSHLFLQLFCCRWIIALLTACAIELPILLLSPLRWIKNRVNQWNQCLMIIGAKHRTLRQIVAKKTGFPFSREWQRNLSTIY